MDSHNLATLFGPNILHTSKGGEFQVETLERAQESQDVIAIVKEVIDHHQKVFEVSNISCDNKSFTKHFLHVFRFIYIFLLNSATRTCMLQVYQYC